MRTTQQVLLYFCLGIFLLGASQLLYSQSTIDFKYGEEEEFEGRLTAYLIMIGLDKSSGQRRTRILRPSDHIIEYDRYSDLTIVLRMIDLELAREEHYATSWLEIPLREYISTDLPGLVLESKTKVLMIGSDDIPRARETGDIRYSIDPYLDREVEGTFRFSFDFISSGLPWKKIDFPPTLKYAIRSPLPLDEADKEIAATEAVVPEEAVRPQAEEETVDRVPLSPKVPEAEASSEEEEALLRSIQEAGNEADIRSLCETYRSQYPKGHYLDEVLYRQILATSDFEDRSRYLEDYVELFPEGSYIIQVNEMIFSDLSGREAEGRGSPTEIVELPGRTLLASIQMSDGILSVADIRGGQPPFRLEFFDAKKRTEKKYALDIGKSRSFRINLNSLPLEKDTYIIGLVDETGSAPYYSSPLKVSSSKPSFKVEIPFITMVLGISILVISVFLLILSRFFSNKRRRKRRRYPSKSYR
jgi:hypothetical protein